MGVRVTKGAPHDQIGRRGVTLVWSGLRVLIAEGKGRGKSQGLILLRWKENQNPMLHLRCMRAGLGERVWTWKGMTEGRSWAIRSKKYGGII